MSTHNNQIIHSISNLKFDFDETLQKKTFSNISKINEDDIIEFTQLSLQEFLPNIQKIGLIPVSVECPICKTSLSQICFRSPTNPIFRCGKKTCGRKKISVYKGTIFEGSQISPQKVVRIIYYFNCRRTNSDVAQSLGISQETARSYYDLLRASLFSFCTHYSTKLGGEGTCVHLDETPWTKRKNKRGKRFRSNTVWVIGAVNIFQKKCAVEFLPSRGHQDVLPFVEEYIQPGTTIHTDCLPTYKILKDMGFTHNSVNHSKTFKSEDGTTTNHIEGIFGSLKRLRRVYGAGFTNISKLNCLLGEWMFRYCYAGWDRNISFQKIIFVLKLIREGIISNE